MAGLLTQEIVGAEFGGGAIVNVADPDPEKLPLALALTVYEPMAGPLVKSAV